MHKWFELVSAEEAEEDHRSLGSKMYFRAWGVAVWMDQRKCTVEYRKRLQQVLLFNSSALLFNYYVKSIIVFVHYKLRL